MTGRRQLWFWLGGVAAFAGLLWLFSAILLPFAAAMVLAYLLDPLVDRLEKWSVGRALGTVIVLAAFFLLVTATLLLLFPVLNAQIADFATRVPELLSALRERLGGFLETLESRLSPADLERARAVAGSFAGDALAALGSLIAGLWSGGLALFNLLALIFITPIVAFYLLRDWDRIIGAVDSWLPLRHSETIRGLAREIDGLLSGFIRGVAMVCLILGVFYAIALTLIGLEFGLIIGLLSGIVSFVPFVGALFGFIVGIGIALSQFGDWLPVALVAVVFVIGQVAEGNWLTPKLVGSRIDLHPVWVMFALLAGGLLFGFLGLVLAVPLAVVISVLVRFGLAQYLKSEFHGPARPPDAE